MVLFLFWCLPLQYKTYSNLVGVQTIHWTEHLFYTWWVLQSVLIFSPWKYNKEEACTFWELLFSQKGPMTIQYMMKYNKGWSFVTNTLKLLNFLIGIGQTQTCNTLFALLVFLAVIFWILHLLLFGVTPSMCVCTRAPVRACVFGFIFFLLLNFLLLF